MTDRTPVVTKAAWTFDIVSHCLYCGKSCKRQRTYYASTEVDASAQADATVAAGIWHRKCGGS